MPRTSAFYEGRVWFGDIDGDIYFSQILTDIKRLNRCYQEQDPTSKDFNELLDTDGGVISLPQAGKVIKLIEVGRALIVFGTNGIWSISGGETNFTANSSSVSKISEVSALGAKTIIQVSDAVFFWSDEGIFALIPDQISGRYTTKSVSLGRIDEDFKLIPFTVKENASGSYDRLNKRIIWLYDEDFEDGDLLLSKYDAGIVYDIKLDAFYDLQLGEIGTGDAVTFISGLFPSSGFFNTTLNNLVEVGGVQVQVNLEDVQASSVIKSISTVRTTALTLGFDSTANNFGITFSSFKDRSFVDWKSVDTVGVTYDSTVETNPETLGEAGIDKQTRYAQTFYETCEADGDLPRGALLTARWEWAEKSSTGRFSNPQQVIKPKRVHGPDDAAKPFFDGFSVSFSRLKLRGHGKSLVLRYTSDSGKDFKLLGWTIPFLGETD